MGWVRAGVGALGLLSAVAIGAGEARAQGMIQSPPPIRSTIDVNGVDLISDTFNLSSQDVAIGPAGSDGLAYVRSFIGAGWTDDLIGAIAASVGVYTVSFGGGSESFNLSGGVYTSLQGRGSTLTYNATAGTYSYTTATGAVVVFSTALATTTATPYANAGRPISVTSADGHLTTYTYQSVSVCATTCPGTMVSASRLQSVNNNGGYQLKLSYASNTATTAADLVAWSRIASVTGINNAVDYCSPTANNCSGFSLAWPNATYATSVGPPATTTVTDALGRVTRYTYDAAGLMTGIKRPSSSIDTTTVTYGGDGRVATVSNETATWSYSYQINAAYQATNVADPLGHGGDVPFIVENGGTGVAGVEHYAAFDGRSSVTGLA